MVIKQLCLDRCAARPCPANSLLFTVHSCLSKSSKCIPLRRLRRRVLLATALSLWRRAHFRTWSSPAGTPRQEGPGRKSFHVLKLWVQHHRHDWPSKCHLAAVGAALRGWGAGDSKHDDLEVTEIVQECCSHAGKKGKSTSPDATLGPAK